MRRALPIMLLLVGCGPSDAQLADSVAKELIRLCPVGKPDDEQARHDCAAKLTDSAVLRDALANPFLWGQQNDEGVLTLGEHVTRFDSRVWRRMYLSLYGFPEGYTVEQRADGRTVLMVHPAFRNHLDMGSYPYPFWHKASKWESYQLATGVMFVIEHGKVTGAVRTFETDPSRENVPHEWSGQWTWRRGEEVMPFVSLYSYLFTHDNPYTKDLDGAYRQMEQVLRSEACLVCHSPDNAVQQPQLELFAYPNQALASRHRIVRALEANTMPKADFDRGIPAGFADEGARRTALESAQHFADLGDRALAWEGEHVDSK